MSVPILANSGVSMTSFLRRTLSNTFAGTLALAAASTALLGSVAVLPARALPTEQVADRLADVPVYVLGNEDGLLLLSTQESADSASVYVFMSKPEADAFIANHPEVSQGNQLLLLSLKELYQQSQPEAEQPLRLTLVPEAAETSQAVALNSEYPGGVPLFYAQREDGSLMPSLPEGSQEPVFPMFFSREDLESNLNTLGQQNPEVRATISIGVLPLEFLIGQLQANDEELYNRIRLLPDSEVIQDISGAQN